MKYTIISYHMGTQGSNLNLLDFNHYLQTTEKIQTLFYTKEIHNIYNTVKESKRKYFFNELKEIREYEPDENSIIFTDFKSIIKLYNEGIQLVCDKLFVFDNNELSYHLNRNRDAKFYHETNAYKILESFKYNDVLFLMPPSNIDEFTKQYPKIPKKVQFKKIEYTLLKNIKFKTKDVLWYRFDEIDVRDEMKKKYGVFVETREEHDEINLWDYKGMIYYRRKHLNYYEQFGRLVFEFILLDKEVHFLKDPFEVNDGLSDYLKFYDIKFDKNFKVLTTSEELQEKMNSKYEFLKDTL